jgi:hypothetical protein
MQFNCWKCGAKIEYPTGSRVMKRDTCPGCDGDLHACRNCQFYDRSKNNQCSEPQAEWVRDKEAANLCDYFQANPTLLALGSPSSKAADAKKKFDSLFKSCICTRESSPRPDASGSACEPAPLVGRRLS